MILKYLPFGDFEVSLSSGIRLTTSIDITQTGSNVGVYIYLKLGGRLNEDLYSGSLEVSSANVSLQC